MKSNIESVRAVLRAIVAAVGLASMAGIYSARAQVTPVGGIARDFTIANHATGQPLRLRAYQGNVVLLDFWAYWCDWCQLASPDIETNIVRHYHNSGGNLNGVPVTVISISIDDTDPAAVNNFIATYGLQLVGDDPSWVAYNQFNNGGIPNFVVLNGTTNSTNHKTWEVLYSTAGYDLTAITNAIESVQTVAPVCTLAAPAAGANVPAPNVALVADVVSNGKIIKAVQFYSGPTLLGSTTTAPYGITWPNVSPGSKTVFARVLYGAGWKADSPAVTFTVGTPGPAPTLSLASSDGARGRGINLSWTAIAGRNYQLQFKTNLVQPGWLNLGGPVGATNTVTSAADTIGSDQQRFYRVVLLP